MKYLITGDSGFVGTNLKIFLGRKGHSYIGVSRTHRDGALLMSTLISQTENVKADAWVHLAGKAHDVSGNAHYEEYEQANYYLTQNVFKKFLECEGAHIFIYFSSVKASANEVEDVLDETNGRGPIGAYGISKKKAEDWLLAQMIPDDKRVVIFRPCMIHGPGNKGNLNLLYNLVRKGIPYPLGAFENERSFLSIDNLCEVIEATCANRQVKSGIYNLADDGYTSTNDLISLMEAVLEKRLSRWNVPVGLVTGIAKIGDVLSLPFNSSRLKKLTENYRVSNNKIKMALSWQRMPVEGKEGLIKTLRSFSQ